MLKGKVTLKKVFICVLFFCIAIFAAAYGYKQYQYPKLQVPEEISVELGMDLQSKAKEEIPDADTITIDLKGNGKGGITPIGVYQGKASLKKTVQKFRITVADTTVPEFVKTVDTLEYDAGSGTKELVLSNFQAEDLSESITYDFRSDVDFQVPGEYVGSVFATDSSGNTVEHTVSLKIKELPKPEPEEKEEAETEVSSNHISTATSVDTSEQWKEEGSIEESQESETIYETSDSRYISVPGVGIYSSLTVGEDQATIDANDVCIFPYYGMPNEGKPMMLAGHENRSLSVLHNIGVGSIITIGWDGATYQYRVFYSGLCTTDRYTKMIDVNTGENMRQYGSGGEILQIYTCHGEQPYRWFVKAERI